MLKRFAIAFIASALFSTVAPLAAQDDYAWISSIRADHPRLFFTADTWPAVRERALTVNADFYAKLCQRAETPTVPDGWWSEHYQGPFRFPEARAGSTVAVGDWGDVLMAAAFVYRVEPTPERLQRIRDMLWASLDAYHALYDENKAVDWYSRTRIGWLAAFDWVWNDLDPAERQAMGESMIEHVDQVLHKPGVARRNSGYQTSGHYGGNNAALFCGLLFYGAGIDDVRAEAILKEGYSNYQKMFAFRQSMAGEDGGAASPTLGYSFADYPNAEWNYIYAMQSATGLDFGQQHAYIAKFPNYIDWNWLPNNLEFGYGDCHHYDNRMPGGWIYTHMSHIMNLFGATQPQDAALAAYVRDKFGGEFITSSFSVWPFLMTALESAPPALDPATDLPSARFFENMGQVFMRSGTGPDDTYCLFACGGISAQHRHYDATHFTIYKNGFLALDSGTRRGNTDGLQNYFAQTVAHNCILIKMPGEAPSKYWNGEVYGQAGGQNKALGSKVLAFETSPEFTYVAGDATPVYNSEKCAEMVRQLVFIPPDHFVVFDRVVATDASYAKRWLLHSANEPVLSGDTWYADQDKGRIFCRTLMPDDAVITKVGGPGKEFLADGVNYSLNAGPAAWAADTGSKVATLDYEEVPELMGRWRMEVSPASPRKGDVFLHLIQVGDQTLDAMSDAEAWHDGTSAYVTFMAGDREVTVAFTLPAGGVSFSVPADGAAPAVGGQIWISRDGENIVEHTFIESIQPPPSAVRNGA